MPALGYRPLTKRERRIAVGFRRLQSGYVKAVTNAVDRFFDAQAQRVVDRYLHRTAEKITRFDLTSVSILKTGRSGIAGIVRERKAGETADIADIFPTSEITTLKTTIDRSVAPVLVAASTHAADLVGVDGLAPDSLAVQMMLARGSDRIVSIDEQTRNAVREMLMEGVDAGYTPLQMAYGVEADGFAGLKALIGETYKNRAATVARTEIATATQYAAHDRYRAADVSEVIISDGVDCGWTSHDDPDKANESVRTIDEADETPISHPNCIRTSIPLRDSEEW